MLKRCLLLLALSSLLIPSLARADRLFAISGAGNTASILYELNPATGAVVQTIGDTGLTHITAIDFHPTTGVLYAHQSALFDSGATNLYTLNINTAAPTLIGSTGLQVPDMSFRSDGTLFAWAEFDFNSLNFDALYTIDIFNANATFVGPGESSALTGLAFDGSDNLFMKTSSAVFSIVPGGSSTFLGFLNNSPGNALAFDSSGVLYTVDGGGGGGASRTLQTIELGALMTTDVGQIPNSISAIAFLPVQGQVPEPASLVLWSILLTSGLASIAWRRHRARASS